MAAHRRQSAGHHRLCTQCDAIIDQTVVFLSKYRSHPFTSVRVTVSINSITPKNNLRSRAANVGGVAGILFCCFLLYGRGRVVANGQQQKKERKTVGIA